MTRTATVGAASQPKRRLIGSATIVEIDAARQALLELHTLGVRWAELPATAGDTKVYDDLGDTHGGGLALWGRGEDGKDCFLAPNSSIQREATTILALGAG